ncbi:aBC transporter ATP-binding protein [Firmicutes bacterium CAG:475]|nr:aBC transporter ATP-binding protein [Firmicutes bacterium CAG:475]
MAKRKNDIENTSVVQNDAITEVEDVCKATEQANEVSETVQNEFSDNSGAQDDYVIEMRHITKEFPGIIANDDITLQLKRGEIHALLGENGAGKSTLMSVLFGLYQPEKGEILKDGKVVKINSPNDATALGIGMVHQHFKLVEVFSVLDNIILGAEPNKAGFLTKKEARKKVVDLSEKYGLKIDPDAIIEDITVGMQQRTEILKMLYRDNEILIFDEPTAVLTPQEIDELMQIMRNLAAEGKSILFITHKLNEIMAVADRCSVLRKGKYIGTVNVADTTKEELSKMMVGRDVKFAVDKDDAQPKGEILKVENLCVESKIHKKLAVKDVSFTVHSGEIVCIAGIDGNGQTELVYGLTGLEKLAPNIDETEERKIDVPVWTKLKNVDKKERAKLFFTQSGEFIRYFFVKLGFKIWDWMKKVGEGIASKCVALWNKLVFVFDKNKRESIDVNADVKGRVYLCGQDITKASIRKRSKTGMSHIPEDRHKHGLVLDYSLEQNMVLQRYWEKDFQAGGFIKKKSVRKYSDNLIAQYDVRSGQGSVTKVRSMSGGNQQKAIVARELDRPHNLLVAVQPTRGLDVGAIEYIHSQIVKDRDEGAGVLLVSLELDEVMNLSDRILVMYEGEIVGELDPKKTTVQELGLYMAGAKRDAKEKNNEEN